MFTSIALYGLFLILLAILAVVAARIFAARDSNGSVRATGLLPGCLFGVGLFFLAVLGFLALLGSLALHTAGSVFEHVPDVQRIYVGTEPERVFGGDRVPAEDQGAWPQGLESPAAEASDESLRFYSDPDRPLHLVFELPGHDASPAGMVPWFREWLDEDVAVRRMNHSDEAGRPTTLIDIAVPASARDMNEIQRDMSLLVPGASWAEGLNIVFKGASLDH